jgi:hypothetical protein
MDKQEPSYISQFIKAHIIDFIFLIVLLVVLYFLYQLYQDNISLRKELSSRPVVMTAQQATDPNYIRNTTGMDKNSAEKTTVIIEKAQQGQIQPQGSIVIQAPSPEKAVEQVSEKIVKKDPIMPPEALEKSDKTIVAPQPENKDYQVGVYKINLQKKNSIGVGVGNHDGKTYIPVAYERLYSQNKAIEIQVNFDIEKKKIQGGQIMHKWFF